ncbi:DUF262 domain-containing protein [Helicobacter sp. MIT 05-5293]|uniref:DUF262 domain-containing protein n=1 Tax=Helicobacter sp. MIT 05-5293 TaxID=1548149 RepID=UPI00051E0723|nr:DUF262 domain-containing protein [Helicobacter sp. MIT 05-5293]TLD82056.1 DUF262 domain-containing protein [Helicobacter sp. MIT 05-5293]
MSSNNQANNEYLKSINELKDSKFCIPSYQRGYRWGEREVKALLEDIWDFTQMENQQDFYCLQPIVMQKDNAQYNVIDGQQRLTTIFLIIKFILNEDFFTIDYQTRFNSVDFLKNIQNKGENDERNIDFYHFVLAYDVIKDFFYKDKDQKEFLDTLLNKCKVLWYEIKDEKVEDVFVRLNIGKIPLTQAENIKALFLSKNDELNFEDLKERAEFWYENELKAREERDFRYCVLSKVDEQDIVKYEEDKPVLKDDISRIEVYLRAIVPHSEKDCLFDYFYKSYKNKTLNKEWEILEEATNTLYGFASKGVEKIDREIFHYLGFLIFNGEKIDALYKQWQTTTDKDIFVQYLFEKIKKRVSPYQIEELTYDKDKKKLKSLLLLFNLSYMIGHESSNDYFKFNRFVLEEWSLEHIYAQKSQSIKEAIKNKNNEEIVKWLEEVKGYIQEKKIIQEKEIIKEIDKSLKKNNFEEELFKKIDENFETDENLHKIQNLTLLDRDSNSKIGNKIFSQKRKEIQKLGDEDKLIPICTGKVFDKVFSDKKDTPDVFTPQDQKDYFNAICEKLNPYMKDKQ